MPKRGYGVGCTDSEGLPIPSAHIIMGNCVMHQISFPNTFSKHLLSQVCMSNCDTKEHSRSTM